MTIKHKKVLAIPDGTNTNITRPSDWNNDHDVTEFGITSSYTIFKDGSYTKAFNTNTNTVELIDTNAGTVLNSIIANMTNGGLIHLKSGTYIGGTITGASNIIIEGEGRNTIYQLANNTNANCFNVTGNNTIIRDMTFDCNKANQSGNGQGLHIYSLSNSILERLYIKNTKGWDCVNIENSNNVKVLYSEIEGADGFGTRIKNSYDVLIHGNNYHNNNKINITSDTSTRLRISHNYLHDSLEDGLALDYNTTYCDVIGNTVYNNNHFGISVDAVYSPYIGNNTITGNIVYKNGWEGINILRSSYNAIVANALRNNGQAIHNTYTEIRLHQVTTGEPSLYNTVSENTILINDVIKAKYGIAEGSSEDNYNLIIGNTVNGAATANGNFYGANTKVINNIGIADNTAQISHTALSNIGINTHAQIDTAIGTTLPGLVTAHAALTTGTHGVSASGFEDKANKNALSGYVGLDASGNINIGSGKTSTIDTAKTGTLDLGLGYLGAVFANSSNWSAGNYALAQKNETRLNCPTGQYIGFYVNNSSIGAIDATGLQIRLGASPTYYLQLGADSAAKPSTNTWTIACDSKVKKDIKDFKDGLSAILKINPRTYKYNGLCGFKDDGKVNIGIIGQEIEAIAPYTINRYKTKLHPEVKNDNTEVELLNFNSHALTFVCINAIKELNDKIEKLKLKQLNMI